jgi:hypothetical protein
MTGHGGRHCMQDNAAVKQDTARVPAVFRRLPALSNKASEGAGKFPRFGLSTAGHRD